MLGIQSCRSEAPVAGSQAGFVLGSCLGRHPKEAQVLTIKVHAFSHEARGSRRRPCHMLCALCCRTTTSPMRPSAIQHCAQENIILTCCSTGWPLSPDHNGIAPVRERLLVDPEVRLNPCGHDAQAAALIVIWGLSFTVLTMTASSRSGKASGFQQGHPAASGSSGGCAASRSGQH